MSTKRVAVAPRCQIPSPKELNSSRSERVFSRNSSARNKCVTLSFHLIILTAHFMLLQQFRKHHAPAYRACMHAAHVLPQWTLHRKLLRAQATKIRLSARMHTHMIPESTRVFTAFPARCTNVRPITGMRETMSSQHSRITESFSAVIACERPFAGVYSLVHYQAVPAAECKRTHRARKRLRIGMHPHVRFKRRGKRECGATYVTDEIERARVTNAVRVHRVRTEESSRAMFAREWAHIVVHVHVVFERALIFRRHAADGTHVYFLGCCLARFARLA